MCSQRQQYHMLLMDAVQPYHMCSQRQQYHMLLMDAEQPYHMCSQRQQYHVLLMDAVQPCHMCSLPCTNVPHRTKMQHISMHISLTLRLQHAKR